MTMFQQGPHERVGGCSTDQTADNTGASALSTSCSPCPGDYYVPSLAIGPGSLSLSYPCGDRSLIHWCSQSSSVFVYNTRGERFDASSAMLPAFVRAEQDNGLVPYLRAQPMLHPYSSTPVQNVQEATRPLLQTRNRTLIPILSKGMGLPVPDVKFNVRSSNGIMYTATTRISDVVRCT